MENNKVDLQYLKLIVKLGFLKYPTLYLLLIISIVSVALEIVAMSLINSISTDQYLILDNIFRTLDKKLIFISILCLFVLRFISIFFVENYQVLIVRKFQYFLSTEAFQKILYQSLNETERKEMGFFISMAGDEASKAAEILNATLKIFHFLVLFILYFGMIIYFDFNVIVIFILLFVCSFFVVKNILRKATQLGEVSLIEGRTASSIFLDGLNALKTIKSFGIEDFIYTQYKKPMYTYQITNYKLFSLALFSRIFPIVLLFSLLTIYVVIDYCGENVLSVTYLVTLFFILLRFLLNLGELLQVGSKILGDLKATNNIAKFINESYCIADNGQKVDTITSILIDSVSFQYNDKILFENLNLNFLKGQSYAVVGKTGSGKSTLIDLILDFKVPTNGNVLFNNINSKEICSRTLKEKILYISQESIIFNDSIKNNLILDKQYTEEEICEVLKIVDLEDLVNDLKDGLNHILQYKGTNISGGQKQRLNIARALLRNPEVLILDESINALDVTTREKVVKNVLNMYKDKIIVFITHDIDILNLIDCVINLDKLKEEK